MENGFQKKKKKNIADVFIVYLLFVFCKKKKN
jgi:hypothetical protein